MKTLGEQIKVLRLNKKMTQDELAQKLNTTKAAISRYESDQRQPKFEVLTEMAIVLGANPDELFSLYFQAENQLEWNNERSSNYFKALTRWIHTVMPEVVKESDEKMFEEWFTSIESPFFFYKNEELATAKSLVSTFLLLDSSWQKELLADAQRYLDFQETKKAKLEKLKQDVE